jgi:hypothetical protein
MIVPHVPSAVDRYSRLFPSVDPAFEVEAMKELGKRMRNRAATDPSASPIPIGNLPLTLPAGFTYFGQFIDHDITRDDTPLWDAAKTAPAATPNGGGGRLDLDHLYGEGPTSSRHGHLFQGDLFRLGEARLPNGEQFDLPLDDRGQPESADERSSENIVLRQLCAMFMKLHNQAVRELPANTPPAERFLRARTRVLWQYQWLLRQQYLGLICSRRVCQDLFGENGDEARPQMIEWEKNGFSIPVEFSHAAFRFGHSMVRPAYRLNGQSGKVRLEDLFFNPNQAGAIPVRHAIGWRKFLRPGAGVERGMAIDTVIATPLFQLPSEHVHHVLQTPAPRLPAELPVRTLVRGTLVGLPTGEEVARHLGASVLPRETPPGYVRDPWADLDELGLTGRTPLWYYVLLEAELEQRGARLGQVGSRLVAEVLEGALRVDPESFLSINGPAWRPPPWITLDGSSVPIKGLFDVAKVVGLTNPSS